jgi:hypothetical protein
MPKRRDALIEISTKLRTQLSALRTLNAECKDADVQWAVLFLEDAIDRVDQGATAAFDMRVAA